MKNIKMRSALLFAIVLFAMFSCFAQNTVPNEEKFTVKAGQWRSIPLLANQDNTEFKISYEVANDRDIQVFVVDSNNFLKFTQKRNFLVSYQGGTVKSGLVEVSLPRGNHYLILDNRYAAFYEKEVWLTYESNKANTSRTDMLEAERRAALQLIRTDMFKAAFDQARAEHSASNFIGKGCYEVAFSPTQSNVAFSEFVGIYRCLMKGSILGISQYDFRVRIVGEVKYQNGNVIRNISSSQTIR